MATAAPTLHPHPEPAQGSGATRVLQLVFGGIGALVAVVLIAGGAAATWALQQRDVNGYFTTVSHHLQTSSYALSSDSLVVGTDGPSWIFGDHFARVRIAATPTDPATPLFVGIGRTADVDRYLARVAHDRITNFDTDPFSVSYRRVSGGAVTSKPGAQRFWRVRDRKSVV